MTHSVGAQNTNTASEKSAHANNAAFNLQGLPRNDKLVFSYTALTMAFLTWGSMPYTNAFKEHPNPRLLKVRFEAVGKNCAGGGRGLLRERERSLDLVGSQPHV